MGYTTKFTGMLEFASEVTVPQLAVLDTVLGEDRRDHPEWEFDSPAGFYFIDLELAEGYSGLRWSGDEKSHGMVQAVNTVLRIMRKTWPEFGLSGRMDAQGEEVGDVWALVVEPGGEARKVEMRLEGRRVECPECEHEFVLDPTVSEVATTESDPS